MNGLGKVIGIMIFLLNVSFAMGSTAVTQNSLTYTEPISTTVFQFDKAELDEQSDLDYLKAGIETPNSYIKVYSTQNPDNKQYAWSELNKFDAKNHYGKLVNKEKLKNVDGWIRYYDGETKNGEKMQYCVTLVRGNAYALYLVEGAIDANNFVTPEVVKNAVFGSIKGIRVENDGSLTLKFWLFSLSIILLAIICKYVVKTKDSWWFIIFSICMLLAYGLGLYFWLGYDWLFSLGVLILEGIVFYAIVCANSWSDFFSRIDKILSHLGD